MGQKISLGAMTLTLFLITASVIIPSSHAVEWSADIQLTLHDDLDSAPSIAQAIDGNIWVVWDSDRTGNKEIFYKIYNGSSWSSEVPLTTNSSYDSYPAVMEANDGKIWVVWDSDRTDNHEIFYKIYNGSSWSNANQLTNDPNYDSNPAIMEANDGKIWVVWDSYRNGRDLNLYYKIFNGSSWSDDMQLTDDPNTNDEDPSITQATGGMIWVVFTKISNETNEEIYYKLFDGTAWSIDINLSRDPSSDLHPSITRTSDGAVWVVWDSDRNGHDDNLYYKFFDTYWRYHKQLTTDLSDDFRPSITQAADGTIWVVWTSTRLANFDIYYKTTVASPYHDIAVISVTTNPTILVRGENASIEVVTQNQGTYGETFEVQCHANSTLIGSTTIFLSPGQTNTIYPSFKWNTTGFPSGTYIISASVAAATNETDLADNSKNVDEPVEVRILGDICGMYEGDLSPVPDGVVDLHDLRAVARLGPYSSEYPTWDPVWGPLCDLNKDGKVGKADLMIISIHFGEK